jgi:two-component system sensor histidine kinase DegS
MAASARGGNRSARHVKNGEFEAPLDWRIGDKGVFTPSTLSPGRATLIIRLPGRQTRSRRNLGGRQATGPRRHHFLKNKTHSLARRYRTELRGHLRKGSPVSSRRAAGLGLKAVSEGLEILDLASIHEGALIALMPAKCSAAVRDKTVKNAGAFFLEVLMPIEKTHRTMVEYVGQLKRINGSLHRRTTELTTSNILLKSEIIKRKAAEQLLRKSEKEHRDLLIEARQMQRRLRHLSHQVLSAQEEERKEISRELHDEIVQTLTGINVQLATLKIEAGVSKTSFSKHINYTQQLVEKSVDIVHRFARDLRPTLLDDLGLIPALQAYMKGLSERTGLRISFSAFSAVEKMRNDKRTVLYRVAQAALVNVAEHAHASSVGVAIKNLPQAVLMEIKDDGKSFDVGHVLDSRRNKRLGLIGMRERVEMVGGTFNVESAPGRGTTISALIPFKRSEQS